jgi:hypothetical protein
LGNAVAERPVFLCDFDQVDNDVIRPSVQLLLLEVIDDAPASGRYLAGG